MQVQGCLQNISRSECERFLWIWMNVSWSESEWKRMWIWKGNLNEGCWMWTWLKASVKTAIWSIMSDWQSESVTRGGAERTAVGNTLLARKLHHIATHKIKVKKQNWKSDSEIISSSETHRKPMRKTQSEHHSPKITQKVTFRKSKSEHSTYIQNQIQNKLENHTQKNIIYYYEIKINHAAGGWGRLSFEQCGLSEKEHMNLKQRSTEKESMCLQTS